MTEDNKVTEVESKKFPVFDFVVGGDMTEKQANNLLDIICLYLESLDCQFIGTMGMLTPEQFAKENKEESEDDDTE